MGVGWDAINSIMTCCVTTLKIYQLNRKVKYIYIFDFILYKLSSDKFLAGTDKVYLEILN